MTKNKKAIACSDCLSLELENCFEEIEFLKNELLESKDIAISTLMQLVRYLQEAKETNILD